jgi:hypothetical protein
MNNQSSIAMWKDSVKNIICKNKQQEAHLYELISQYARINIQNYGELLKNFKNMNY